MTLDGAVGQITRVDYSCVPSRKAFGLPNEVRGAAGTVAATPVPKRYKLHLSALAREGEDALIANPVDLIGFRKV